MTDQQKVREAFEHVMGPRLARLDSSWFAKWGDGEYVIQAVQHAWEGWQAALAHASSATTNSQESSSRVVDAKDAARWRDLCRQIDASDPVSNEASTIRNIVDDAINLGSTCLVMHIDQAIAGRRGDGNG